MSDPKKPGFFEPLKMWRVWPLKFKILFSIYFILGTALFTLVAEVWR